MPNLIISVVTPSFNQARFIRATINSVIDQTYPNVEYLIVDGGSTDETLNILRSYGDQIKWISGVDKGQSDAINRGWLRTKGDVLAWLNSDDVYYPGALETVAEFFETHPQIEWLYGDCDIINIEGKPIKSYPVQSYNYIDFLRGTNNFIPQPATFIRRSVFEHCGKLNEELHFLMDMEYWLRIGLEYSGTYIPVRLAGLRLHGGAKSVCNLSGFAKELIQVYKNFFDRNDLPISLQSLQRSALANAYFRATDMAFWGKNIDLARRYAWKGFLLYPIHPKRLWIFLLLGNWGRSLAERLFPNPYF